MSQQSVDALCAAIEGLASSIDRNQRAIDNLQSAVDEMDPPPRPRLRLVTDDVV